MPRAYGLTELQKIVDEAWRLAKLDPRRTEEDAPDVRDILFKLKISHSQNRDFVPGQPSSWHEG